MGASGDFDVRRETLPGAVVVRVEGELDMASVPELEEAVAASASAPQLVIDLTRCTFVDSAGVRALVGAAGEASESRLALVVTDPGILRVLQITGVDAMVAVHGSLDAAI
jgi:anti-anti-sigma factor